MREKEITEGLGELADIAERDHEVQMARAQLYKSAKYAIKLHDMLKGVSEAEGLEGWVQSKITKASDMLGSVYHHLDYEESGLADEAVVGESNSTNKVPLIESTEFLAMPDHLVDVYLESLTIEQLEILEEGVLGAIGKGIAGTAKLAAKGAVGGAKLAAKGAKAALINKKGNLRLSTAGRADSAEAKLKKIQAKKKDKERLAKAKADLAKQPPGTLAKLKKAGADAVNKAMGGAKLATESQKDTHCKDECCGSEVKREDCKCPPDCKHCNCNDSSIPEEVTYKETLHSKLEGMKKFKSAAHRKAVHAGKASGKRK